MATAQLPEGYTLDPEPAAPAGAIANDRFEQPGDMQPPDPSSLPEGYTLDPPSTAENVLGYAAAGIPGLMFGQHSWPANIERGIAERGFQIVGGVAGAAASVNDALESYVGKPPFQDPNAKEWLPQKLKEIQAGLQNPNLGYNPSTTWQDVKKAPLSNFIPYAIEQGLVSAPDMYAVLTNWPGYLVSQEGEISYNRAQNEGKPEPTVTDLLAAAPGAVLNTLMEKIGVEKMVGLNDAAVTSLKQLGKDVLKTAGVEGGTEAIQQGGQYASETAGTGKFSWGELADQALQAAVVGAVFGPAVRTPLAGLELATQPKEDKTQADQTQPEGLPAVPDAAGTHTPGAPIAGTAAPPAGTPAQHTEQAPLSTVPATSSPEPAAGVDVVQPGTVAPDLQAATGAAAAPEEDQGIEQGNPDEEQLSPEEQAQRDLQMQSLAELNAQPVEAPPAKAPPKRSRKKPPVAPEQGITPEIVPVQQEPVVAAPVVPSPAISTAPIVAPALSEAPVPVAPAAATPLTADQLDEGDDEIAALMGTAPPSPTPALPPGFTLDPPAAVPTQAPAPVPRETPDELARLRQANDIFNAAVSNGQGSDKARAARDKFLAETAPAPASPVEPRTAAPVAEAPTAQPAAPTQPAPAPAAPAPKNRQVVGLTLDELRHRLGGDAVSDHPAFEEAIKAVASRFAENLPKGVAPARAVREQAGDLVQEVRDHVAQGEAAAVETAAREAEAEKKRGDAAQEEAKRLDKERREGKGAPQEKARAGKTKKKTADEMASENEKAIRRAADKNAKQPEAEQDPHLREWERLRKLRQVAKQDERGSFTRLMAAEQGKRVAARRAAQEAEAKPPAEPKPAEPPKAPTTSELSAQESPAAPKKRQAGKVAPAAEKAIRETPEPDWSKIQTIPRLLPKVREYVRSLVEKAGLGKEEVPNLQKHPLGKNLLLWARQQAAKGGEDLGDVPMVVMLYKLGDYDAVRGIIGSQILGGGSYTDVDVGNLEEAEPTVTERNVSDESVYDLSPADKTGNWFNAKSGKHEAFSYERRTTGSQALDEARRRSGPVSKLAGLIENQHIRLLRQLVGDVPVFWVSNAEMQRMYPGRQAMGLYTNFEATDRARGVKPSVMLNSDVLAGKPAHEVRQVILHEMTHAATSYALSTNLRGTRDIVERMMRQVEAQMSPTDRQEFDNAFKNPREFVAEAFSNAAFQEVLASLEMPPRIQLALAGRVPNIMGRPLTWWNGFVAAVKNAINMVGGVGGRSYMDGIVAVYPQTLLSSVGQEERATQLAVRDIADRMAEPGSILDLKTIGQHVNDTVGAARTALMERTGGDLRRGARMLLGTTEDLSRRADQRKLFDGSFRESVYTRYNDAILTGRHVLNQMFTNGPTGNPAEGPEKLLLDLARLNRGSPREVEALSNVLYDSTVAGVDPTTAVNTGRNKHISKAGYKDEHTRAEHARQQAAFQALSPQMQAVGRRIVKIYDDILNTSNRKTLRNIVDSNVNTHGLKLPAGETTDTVVDWVMNGGIDKPVPADPANPQPNERNGRDSALHKALGETAKTLADVTALRKAKGAYVPLMRNGGKFFMATRPVKPPSGAVVDKSSPHGNVLIFKDKKKLKAFQKSNSEQIDSVVSRFINPATGQRVHSKDVNAQQFFFATVQNRTMEMDDNSARLKKLRQEYMQRGEEVSDVMFADRELFKDSAIMPAQISRLIRNIEQAMGQGTAAKGTVGAVVSAYSRQLAGNRAAHHRLKRRAIKGFNRELLPNIHQSMRMLSGHLANLDQGPRIAVLEKEVKDEIAKKSKGNYGKFGDTLERQALFAESQSRQLASFNGGGDFAGRELLRKINEVSYLYRLGTPVFTVMQFLQPWTSTLPQLAARYGPLKTMGVLAKVLYRLSFGAKLLGQGGLETGRAIAGVTKPPTKAFDYAAHTKRQIRGLYGADQADAEGLLDDMEAYGIGAGGGIEAPELGEIGRGAGGIALNRMSRVFRGFPEAAEAINRHLTGLAAFELARRAGKSGPDARREALSWVEATQGGYAQENNPNFLSYKWAKLPMQFKKYPLMYGQAWWGSVARAVSADTDPAVRREAMRTVAYMSVMGAMMAGTLGLPLMEVMRGVLLAANAVGLSDDDWESYENWIQELFSGILGDTMGEATTRGVSRLAGIDLSNRLGNDNLVFFGDPKSMKDTDVKSWLWDLAIGAPGGMVGDTIAHIHNHEWSGAFPLPKVLQDTMAAGYGMAGGTTTSTGKQVSKPWSLPKAAAKVLGFRPASEARRWEAGGAATEQKAEKKLSADRTALMGKWYNASDRGAFWRTEIRDWNRTHKGAEKIEYGDLAKSRRRRDQEKRKTLEGAD